MIYMAERGRGGKNVFCVVTYWDIPVLTSIISNDSLNLSGLREIF